MTIKVSSSGYSGIILGLLYAIQQLPKDIAKANEWTDGENKTDYIRTCYKQVYSVKTALKEMDMDGYLREFEAKLREVDDGKGLGLLPNNPLLQVN